jgi:hypothetical protein
MRLTLRRTSRALGRTRLATLTLLVAGAFTSACEGDFYAATGVFAGGGAIIAPQPSELVGTWRRVEVVSGTSGPTRSSETTWTFGTDGAAVFTGVARSSTAEFSDVLVRRGRWRTEGSVIVVKFLDTGASTVQLTWTLVHTSSGTTLILDGDEYDRASP